MKGKGNLEEVDDGEIVPPAASRNLSQKVHRVSRGGPLGCHENSPKILGKGPEEGFVCRPYRKVADRGEDVGSIRKITGCIPYLTLCRIVHDME